MAKKTKRSRRKATLTKATKTRQEQPTSVSRPAMTAKTTAPTKVDLAQEYYYVFADLRKIAIIAAVMFALLFALAFLLR